MEQMLPRSASWPVAAIAANLPVILNQVFNSAGNFVVTIALLRLLGLADFGHFSVYFLVALSAVSVLAAAVTMPAVSIAASESEDSRRGLLSAAGVLLVVGVLVGVVLAAAVQLALTVARVDVQILLLPFAALFAAMALNDIARRILLFERALVAVWLLDVLRFLAVALVLVWGADHQGTEPVAFIMIQLAVAYAVALGGLVVILLPALRAAAFARFPEQARRLLRTGRWLSASAILQLVHDNIFVFVGSAVLGTEAVGIVRACQSLIGVVHPVFLALEHILPRRIGQLVRQHGWTRALHEYGRLAVAASGGLLLLLGVMAILAQPLLYLAAGPEVASYAWVMQGLCLSWVPYLTYIMITFPLRAIERTRALATSLAASTLVAIAISAPAVSQFGIAGIVGGMIVANLVSAALLTLQYTLILRREFAR